jgi:hypothetical protein
MLWCSPRSITRHGCGAVQARIPRSSTPTVPLVSTPGFRGNLIGNQMRGNLRRELRPPCRLPPSCNQPSCNLSADLHGALRTTSVKLYVSQAAIFARFFGSVTPRALMRFRVASASDAEVEQPFSLAGSAKTLAPQWVVGQIIVERRLLVGEAFKILPAFLGHLLQLFDPVVYGHLERKEWTAGVHKVADAFTEAISPICGGKWK